MGNSNTDLEARVSRLEELLTDIRDHVLDLLDPEDANDAEIRVRLTENWLERSTS